MFQNFLDTTQSAQFSSLIAHAFPDIQKQIRENLMRLKDVCLLFYLCANINRTTCYINIIETYKFLHKFYIKYDSYTKKKENWKAGGKLNLFHPI